jgi:hypothetical protein
VIKRTLPILSILLLLMSAMSRSAVADDCRGRISTGAGLSGLTEYNPYSPVDVADSFRLSIANVGNDACYFGLLFRPRIAAPKLGNTLSFEVKSTTGTSLLTMAPAVFAPLARLGSRLSPSATAAIEFQIVVPRGQFAAPGSYDTTIDLELYAAGYGGWFYGQSLHTAPLTITYRVAEELSVSLRGGALATTLAFGGLERGAQRSVNIDVRGNRQYQLRVTSQNSGRLLLTPPIPGKDWAVPYSLALGGQTVTLSSSAYLAIRPPTLPNSDASYTATVTIGDVAGKRAGRYQDVITVEVRPPA